MNTSLRMGGARENTQKLPPSQRSLSQIFVDVSNLNKWHMLTFQVLFCLYLAVVSSCHHVNVQKVPWKKREQQQPMSIEDEDCKAYTAASNDLEGNDNNPARGEEDSSAQPQGQSDHLSGVELDKLLEGVSWNAECEESDVSSNPYIDDDEERSAPIAVDGAADGSSNDELAEAHNHAPHAEHYDEGAAKDGLAIENEEVNSQQGSPESNVDVDARSSDDERDAEAVPEGDEEQTELRKDGMESALLTDASEGVESEVVVDVGNMQMPQIDSNEAAAEPSEIITSDPPAEPLEPRVGLTNAEMEALVIEFPPHTKIKVTYCEPAESPDVVVCYGKLFEMRKVRRTKVWDVSYILEDDDGDMSWYRAQIPPASGRNDPKVIVYDIVAVRDFPEGLLCETRDQRQRQELEKQKQKAAAAAKMVYLVDDDDDSGAPKPGASERLAIKDDAQLERDVATIVDNAGKPGKKQPAKKQRQETAAAVKVEGPMPHTEGAAPSAQPLAAEEEDDTLAKKYLPTLPSAALDQEEPSSTTIVTTGTADAMAKVPTPRKLSPPKPVRQAKLLLEEDDDGGESAARPAPPAKPLIGAKLAVKVPVAQPPLSGGLPAPLKPKSVAAPAATNDERKKVADALGVKLVNKSVTTPSIAKLPQMSSQSSRAPGSSKRNEVRKEELISPVATVAEGILFASPSVLLASHSDDVVVPCAACREPLSSLSLLWFTHLLTVSSCQGSPGRLSTNRDGRGQIECCQCKRLLTVAENNTTMMHKRCKDRQGGADAPNAAAKKNLSLTVDRKPRSPPAATYTRQRSPAYSSYRRDAAPTAYDRDTRARSRTPPTALNRDPYVRPRSRSPPAAYARPRSRTPPSTYTRPRSRSPYARARSPAAEYARARSRTPPASYTRPRSRTPPTAYAARPRSRSPLSASYRRDARPRSRSPYADRYAAPATYDRYSSRPKSPPVYPARQRSPSYTRDRSPPPTKYRVDTGRPRSRTPPSTLNSRPAPASFTRGRSRSPVAASNSSASTSATPSAAMPPQTRRAANDEFDDWVASAPPSFTANIPGMSTAPPLAQLATRRYVNPSETPVFSSIPVTSSSKFEPILPDPRTAVPQVSSEPRFLGNIAGIKSAAESAVQAPKGPVYNKKGKLLQPASYTYVAPPTNAPPRVGYLMPPGVGAPAAAAAPLDDPSSRRKRSRSRSSSLNARRRSGRGGRSL